MGAAPWHLSQFAGDVSVAEPQVGVSFSKWQLTLVHFPRSGAVVWSQAEVLFLYVVVSGELLMRDETFMSPSRWEDE